MKTFVYTFLSSNAQGTFCVSRALGDALAGYVRFRSLERQMIAAAYYDSRLLNCVQVVAALKWMLLFTDPLLKELLPKVVDNMAMGVELRLKRGGVVWFVEVDVRNADQDESCVVEVKCGHYWGLIKPRRQKLVLKETGLRPEDHHRLAAIVDVALAEFFSLIDGK
jgi:hypothetical protein